MSLDRLSLAILGDIGHVNLQRWCESLAGAGIDLTVISFAKAPPGEYVAHQIPALHCATKLNYFFTVPYLRRLLNCVAPDVVVAYSVTGYGTLAALSEFHPVVQVTSGSDVLLAHTRPWLDYFARYSLQKADLVTAWAPHMAVAAHRLGADDNRIFVLPRGIPAKPFTSFCCRQPNSTEEPIRLICTRSLKAGYGIEHLLAVTAELKAIGLRFVLTMAGDGPLRAQVERQINQNGLDNEVQLMGFVPNHDLPKILADHDLYISLVPSDGVSASLLEAMGAGLLPIVPHHPANEYWIEHQKTGILLDAEDPAAIAQAIYVAAGDVALRTRARTVNPVLVQQKADMTTNAVLYKQRFAKLCTR